MEGRIENLFGKSKDPNISFHGKFRLENPRSAFSELNGPTPVIIQKFNSDTDKLEKMGFTK